MICPHCQQPDSIEHTFMQCRHLHEDEYMALGCTVFTKANISSRKKAIEKVIEIGIRREKHVSLNSIITHEDLRNRKVTFCKDSKWFTGNISFYDTNSKQAIINLSTEEHVSLNLLESLKNSICWIHPMDHIMDFSYSQHQAPASSVTVLRADGHTMANSTFPT